MRRLPPEILTLYAELVEQLTASEARRSIGHAPGTFVTKEVKGKSYVYFQYSVPGGSTRQVYLGRRSRELDALAKQFAGERVDVDGERADIERLCALLRVGGAAVTDAPSARVIAALADAAVFRLGGVLVGTHAFIVLMNMLGVRWEHGLLRTEDVDVAAERTLAVAVTDVTADVPKALDSLKMGFLPVPGLSHSHPATSFMVRGQRLRVDLVTPAVGKASGPVLIARFQAAAAPLPYLDYLLEEPQNAAVIDGGGVLVQVPHPARFAVHKLLVAQSRPAAFQTKSEKDLRQAAYLIDLLAEDRPGDLALAWTAVETRGVRWRRTAGEALTALARRFPETAERLRRSARIKGVGSRS